MENSKQAFDRDIANGNKKLPRLILLGISLIFLLVYSSTRAADFVWDDLIWVQDNPRLDEPLFSGLTTTQHSHMGIGNAESVRPPYESYRPVAFASVWLDRRLFGQRPGPMHVENLLLALLYLPLTFLIAQKVLKSATAAVVATSVFLLHPMQVEVFAYISARGDILAGLFATVSVVCLLYEWPKQRTVRISLIAALFLLSLLSKEAQIGMPIAVIAVALAIQKLRQWWPEVLAMVVTVVVYLAARLAFVGASSTYVEESDVFAAALQVPGIALSFLQSFVWPFDLSIARPVHSSYAPFGWLLTAICAGTLVLLARRSPPRSFASSTVAVLCSSWLWLVCLIGPSAIPAMSLKACGDRYAHLGLLGLSIGFAALTLNLFGRHDANTTLKLPLTVQRFTPQAFMTIVAVFALTLTHLQVSYWQSNFELYNRALQVEPKSAFANYQVGYLLSAARRWDEAAERLQLAVKFDPGNSRAYNNLGVAYLNLNKVPQAEAAFLESLRVSGNANHRAWANLGSALLKQSRVADACRAWQAATKLAPDYLRASEATKRNCSSSQIEGQKIPTDLPTREVTP